jgi:cytochrome c
MKKALAIVTGLAFIVACSNSTDTKDTKEEASTTTAAAPADPEVEKGLELVGKSDCFQCHKIVDAAIGPSYEAVAAKYPDNDAVVDSLAGKIITGGAGNWGSVPMTPHPDVSREDARTMVKYVLSLK